jgi:hypothetical protein
MSPRNSDEMPAEFSFRSGAGVRGKYYERYTQGPIVTLVFAEPEGAGLLASFSSAGLRTPGITRSEMSTFTFQMPAVMANAR